MKNKERIGERDCPPPLLFLGNQELKVNISIFNPLITELFYENLQVKPNYMTCKLINQ